MKDMEQGGWIRRRGARAERRVWSSKVTPVQELAAQSSQHPRQGALLMPDNQHTDDFLRTMDSLLRSAAWVGLGLSSGRRGPRAVSTLVLLGLAAIVTAAGRRLFRVLVGWAQHAKGKEGIATRTAGFIFYANSLGALALSWRVVRRWGRLGAHWAATERHAAPLLRPCLRVRTHLLALTALVALGSMVEHVLSFVSSVGAACPPSEFLYTYITNSHHFLLEQDDYNIWLGLVILMLSNFATVLWNFQDLLIILLSVGLASRYKRLNAMLAQLTNYNTAGDFNITGGGGGGGGVRARSVGGVWRRAREAYTRQAALVRHANAALGPLVLLSNLNNFYFICLQLFNGVASGAASQGPLLSRVYYLLSLGWLVARAVLVVLAAAAVHAHSTRALPCLHACPPHHYSVEVSRLQTLLMKDYVAISAMGFFDITRTFLLNVLGAIITYELVLVQYEDPEDNPPPGT